ncbi:wiskott-Aldrich syndrome protein family member 2-like isoform X1 [Brienomyrus brachyistius]|uniref:wiskott-Aldrich syndrome protein family member 2-like isoform X1 n=1 Tax=Brienomyrus brachyistius TaxID=42636 RepID=UPI0020B18BE5|nr:wiskott-Aldrich syndrome protein family member 2-like isoform X1 [Brienomyrus brachyistius]
MATLALSAPGACAAAPSPESAPKVRLPAASPAPKTLVGQFLVLKGLYWQGMENLAVQDPPEAVPLLKQLWGEFADCNPDSPPQEMDKAEETLKKLLHLRKKEQALSAGDLASPEVHHPPVVSAPEAHLPVLPDLAPVPVSPAPFPIAPSPDPAPLELSEEEELEWDPLGLTLKPSPGTPSGRSPQPPPRHDRSQPGPHLSVSRRERGHLRRGRIPPAPPPSSPLVPLASAQQSPAVPPVVTYWSCCGSPCSTSSVAFTFRGSNSLLASSGSSFAFLHALFRVPSACCLAVA